MFLGCPSVRPLRHAISPYLVEGRISMKFTADIHHLSGNF